MRRTLALVEDFVKFCIGSCPISVEIMSEFMHLFEFTQSNRGEEFSEHTPKNLTAPPG